MTRAARGAALGRAVALAAGLAGALGCTQLSRAPLEGPRERAPFLLPSPDAAARPERVLLVSVHGLTPARYLEGLEDPGAAPPAMPTLAALARQGVAADALIPVFPAATYPAHATLASGLPPARHRVASDRRIGPRGVRSETYSHASFVSGPTLWQSAAEAGRPVALLDWPATQGASVQALLPDGFVPGRGASWLEFLNQRATPGVVDLAREAGAGAAAAGPPGPLHDRVLTRVACGLLASDSPPGLLLLRFSQTQPAFERYGPQSSQARAAFERVDRELAELVACLERAGRLASSAIAVAGDHGVAPVHTRVRPNAVLVDAGLIETGARGRIRSWSALARSNGGTAFVYAKDDEAAVAARRALEDAARETRVFRVLSAERMLALAGDPEAWFGLEATPGYAFDDGIGAPLLAAASARGSGGYLPERRAMAAGFVAYGPGLRRGLRVPELAQVDVAPTLASLLGLPLHGVEGRAVVGLLEPNEAHGRALGADGERAR